LDPAQCNRGNDSKNPGWLQEWPDGPTFSAWAGTYDVTFEINAVAAADGSVSVQQERELVIYEPQFLFSVLLRD
jgi:hypothetical protein